MFVLRQEAVERGFQDQIVRMIQENGFEILATRVLSPIEAEYAAARTRGGNWEAGRPFSLSGGPPAVAVVAYDREPLPLNRRAAPQVSRSGPTLGFSSRRRFATRSSPSCRPHEAFNALHSSDHAAEAWHLIEVLAPELVEQIQARLHQIHAATPPDPTLRRAA